MRRPRARRSRNCVAKSPSARAAAPSPASCPPRRRPTTRAAPNPSPWPRPASAARARPPDGRAPPPRRPRSSRASPRRPPLSRVEARRPAAARAPDAVRGVLERRARAGGVEAPPGRAVEDDLLAAQRVLDRAAQRLVGVVSACLRGRRRSWIGAAVCVRPPDIQTATLIAASMIVDARRSGAHRAAATKIQASPNAAPLACILRAPPDGPVLDAASPSTLAERVMEVVKLDLLEGGEVSVSVVASRSLSGHRRRSRTTLTLAQNAQNQNECPR